MYVLWFLSMLLPDMEGRDTSVLILCLEGNCKEDGTLGGSVI